MTEGEMVGWHHQLSGHEFEQIPGDSEGQESPGCYGPWGHKESDTTQQLNNKQTKKNPVIYSQHPSENWGNRPKKLYTIPRFHRHGSGTETPNPEISLPIFASYTSIGLQSLSCTCFALVSAQLIKNNSLCNILCTISLVAQMVKNLPAMQETQVQSLGQEDPLEKRMATHSQYSCLENSMDREAWWATLHGITKSQTQLRD